MDLRKQIELWLTSPGSLGCEAQCASIVGSVAAALGEEIPENVRRALKALALRQTILDIGTPPPQRSGEIRRPGQAEFRGTAAAALAQVAAATGAFSWTEAIAEITIYVRQRLERLPA